MKIDKYVFGGLKTKKEKKDLTEFFRHETTAEYGGYQMFDGTRTHLMHNPEELSDFIYFLKSYEKKKRKKIRNFLEIGFNSGKVNTVLNKFFNFEQIVAVDNFTADISSTDLMANLRRKNLTLICGNSDKKETLRIIKKFQPFDLIFVDANHEYMGTKKDLSNYCTMLSDHGILAVHDIHSLEYPGVNKAWNEFKLQNNFMFKEIVNKKYYFVCGVGLAIKKP
ncbi:class I SAM-dependent methyltransferase [Marine Group I thaumarchaeote]|jgi:hypothetical protein|uniref:Class I SAM-dependent methyltransferase n=1 Tax=Marine Group I thaumarchaeote TaxID=2511932 RepID=A0A7K4NM30_9ARCH|nr:class I SAM-dependent methyltransferase [Marine Group I thaumarchaeote]